MSDFTEEEYKFLTTPSKYHKELRCACGHLWVLHNGHCCSFCTVPNCKCEES